MKWANSRGGVGGRTINLRVYDDGGDPARHRAQVQEAIETARVIGFLSNVEPVTGEQSIDYVTAKRRPIIGLSLAESWAYRSPMYFPQGPAADALLQASMQTWAEAALATGKANFGSLVCVEAQFCRDGERFFKQHAAAYGFRPVYSGQTSLANPDYTADCLAARNAGVEVLAIMLDTASIARVASSCGRQGYRPRYVIVAATQTDAFKDNGFLDGITLASPIFPYFATGTPARDEFQTAKRTFGAGITPSVGVAQGWTAGKMLERAARDLPEPATNEALLSALWSFQDESLGGLTPPLTFLRDKAVSPRACWFPIATRGGSWVTLSDALRCAA